MTATTERPAASTAAIERRARAEASRLGYELKKNRLRHLQGRPWELWESSGTYLFRLTHLTLEEAVQYMRAVPAKDAAALNEEIIREQISDEGNRRRAHEQYSRLVRLGEKTELKHDALLRGLGGLPPHSIVDRIIVDGGPYAATLISHSLAAAVTEAMKAAGMYTTSQLAAMAGPNVDVDRLYECLAGNRPFYMEELADVATALGTTSSALLEKAVA